MTGGQKMVAGLNTERLLRVLETMPNAFFALDADLRITYVNAEGESLLRSSRDAIVGHILLEAFPDAVSAGFDFECRHALETDLRAVFETYSAPLGSWFEVHAWPDQGGLNVSFSNITERRSAELQRARALSEAEQAHTRLSFVTRLAAQLAGLRTPLEVFDRLTRTVVPAVADWCTLVVPGAEELVRVAAAHRDPTLDRLVKRLVGAYPHSYSGPSPGVVVYRSGEPMRLARLARQIVADLDDSVASTAYGRTLLLLGDGPGLIMPIKSQGDVVAILTMVRSSGEPFTDDDIAVMGDVAKIVATSLRDAQLVQTQRETARALQAAALPTTLPTFDGLELSAGYRAATAGSQVGGDWYDAFVLASGAIALVVGDAAGHGLEAAAVMAKMRNALRAQLFASPSPSESLSRLSALLAAHEPDAFATIVCVVIDATSGQAVWASAGHPAPILVRPGGSATHLRGLPGPPIGWVDATSEQHSLVLAPGDRLILFTDGLIEQRGVNLDIGLTHLMILAEQTSGRDATGACESILGDIPLANHEDDVCLLVADFKP